jgi:hypothetical protein
MYISPRSSGLFICWQYAVTKFKPGELNLVARVSVFRGFTFSSVVGSIVHDSGQHSKMQICLYPGFFQDVKS